MLVHLLPLLKGLAIGFVVAIPTGPVGFICVERTLLRGFRPGMISAIGSVIADVLYAVVIAFSLSHIVDFLFIHKVPIRIAGAALLFYLGISGIMTKHIPKADYKEKVAQEASSTFFLTITNPTLIISYGLLFSAVGIQGHGNTYENAAIFVAGVLVGSLLFWYLFIKLLIHINERVYHLDIDMVNKIASVLILLSGIAILGTLFL